MLLSIILSISSLSLLLSSPMSAAGEDEGNPSNESWPTTTGSFTSLSVSLLITTTEPSSWLFNGITSVSSLINAHETQLLCLFLRKTWERWGFGEGFERGRKLRGEIEVWSEEAAMMTTEKNRVDSVVTQSQTRSVSPSCLFLNGRLSLLQDLWSREEFHVAVFWYDYVRSNLTAVIYCLTYSCVWLRWWTVTITNYLSEREVLVQTHRSFFGWWKEYCPQVRI